MFIAKCFYHVESRSIILEKNETKSFFNGKSIHELNLALKNLNAIINKF